MPLVINSYRVNMSTRTHTHIHAYRFLHRNNFNKPGVSAAGQHTPGLITATIS